MRLATRPSYDSLHAGALSQKDRNCCAVIAVSVACSISYEAAYEVCKAEGRRHGCGMEPSAYLRAIRKLGFGIVTHLGWVMESDATSRRLIYREPRKDNPMSKVKGVIGGEKILQQHFSHRVFLLRSRTHVCTFDGQKIQDYTHTKRYHVQEIHEILPLNIPG